MTNIVESVDLRDAVPRPSEKHIAKVGPRRLVKLAPLLGGVPIIWKSPQPIEDQDENGVKGQYWCCIVLVTKTPKPETMRVNIPLDLYEQLHDVPVEW